MPERFDYPSPGWSTGTMRKVGDDNQYIGDKEIEDPMVKFLAQQKFSSEAIQTQKAHITALSGQYRWSRMAQAIESYG